jgi:hypothetical protein
MKSKHLSTANAGIKLRSRTIAVRWPMPSDVSCEKSNGQLGSQSHGNTWWAWDTLNESSFMRRSTGESADHEDPVRYVCGRCSWRFVTSGEQRSHMCTKRSGSLNWQVSSTLRTVGRLSSRWKPHAIWSERSVAYTTETCWRRGYGNCARARKVSRDRVSGVWRVRTEAARRGDCLMASTKREDLRSFLASPSPGRPSISVNRCSCAAHTQRRPTSAQTFRSVVEA